MRGDPTLPLVFTRDEALDAGMSRHQIAHRVRFMGGDPTVIAATSDGNWQHLKPGKIEPGKTERRIEFEGKVHSLIYDRYGDFDGFVLDTEDGQRRFRTAERPIERVVLRAWAHRIRTTVIVEIDDEDRPETIVLSGPYTDDE